MQPEYMVVTFNEDGEVNAMHRDIFDLGFLGRQEITRASEILFDEAQQKWAVHLPDGKGGYGRAILAARGFALYNEARDFEVRWLEHCALRGVEPMSFEGIAIANTERGFNPT